MNSTDPVDIKINRSIKSKKSKRKVSPRPQAVVIDLFGEVAVGKKEERKLHHLVEREKDLPWPDQTPPRKTRRGKDERTKRTVVQDPSITNTFDSLDSEL